MTTSDPLPERIDFLPLAGLSDLAGVSQRFGELIGRESSEDIDGAKEDPGRQENTILTIEGADVSLPAWVGVRWMEDSQADQALDGICKTLIEECADVAFALIRRNLSQDTKRPYFMAHFRWPGTMGASDYRLISGWVPPHPNEPAAEPRREHLDLEAAIDECLKEVPQAREYFRALKHAESMKKALPQPLQSAGKGPRL